MTDGAAPTSPEQARANANAWIAQGRASASATRHAQAVADLGPADGPCDPMPRPPACGVTSAPVPVDVAGCSHKAPPVDVEVIGEAHVLAALDAMAAAFERCSRRVVTRGRALPARSFDVDDYVSGAR